MTTVMTSPIFVSEPPADLALTRQRRAAARSRELAELLGRRPELSGVHPPADLAAEAVRWSA